MKILVTGATGFIGKHIVQWLVNHGYNVIATGTSIEKAKQMEWIDRVQFIPCDIFSIDIDGFHQLGEPELLIHCAWSGVYDDSVSQQFEINLEGNIHFLSSFINSRCKKIVCLGSFKEYGDVSETKLHEGIYPCPNTPYGIVKDTIRKYLELSCKDKLMNWNWVRLFHQIGDGQDKKSFQGQLEQAVKNKQKSFPMSGGEQIRDFLPVETAAEFICKISLQDKINGVVNCCSGIPRTLEDYAQQYITDCNSPIILDLGAFPYRKNEPMKQWGDIKLLTQCIKEYDVI